MSNAGAINYSIGGDASALRGAFEYALRYKDDFLNNLKRAFSVRGMFDGITTGIKDAFGGANLGDLISKNFRGLVENEQIQQQFEGLLGGKSGVATKFLKELKDFASDANFSKEEVISSAARMVAQDMNPRRVIESFKTLGDVARGVKAPIGELADMWGKIFAEDKVSTRDLLDLKRMGVTKIFEALSDSMEVPIDRVKQLGEQGKISFDDINTAMQRLTGGNGVFAGQMERYKNSLGALVDDTKETFGKIPGAFFSGILGVGFGQAKDRVKEIRATLQEWVRIAQGFGESLGVALKVATGLWKEGLLFTAIKDGLIGMFGGAVDYLAKALAGAAMGFASAMLAAINYAADLFAWKLTPGATDKTKPKAGDIGNAALAGFNQGFDSVDGPGFGRAAMERFNKLVGPRAFAARGGVERAMQDVMAPVRFSLAQLMPGVFAGSQAQDMEYLERANNAKKRPVKMQQNFAAPDDYAKIGLYVGAGGPQGEAHARDTAKNTAQAVDQLKQIKGVLNRRGGLTKFSS